MRALAGAALVALAVAGCGSSRSGATTSPSTISASPSLVASACNSRPTPSAPGKDQSGGFSVVISQGQAVQRQATVRAQQLLFAVKVAWNRGDVQLTLTTPSGKVYDRGTTDPTANHHVQPNAESFSIHHPEPGSWTIELFGASIPTSSEPVGVSLTQMPLSDFAPIAVYSGSTDRGVVPLSVQFSGQADGFDGATITSYQWDFGDCSPSASGANVTHVFKSAGTFTVTFTATDSNGQSDFTYSDVVVTAYDHPPTASFIWATLDPSKPKQVSFDGTKSDDIDGQVTSYTWNFGDGASGSGKYPVHDYVVGGTYAVSLTVTDNGGLGGSLCEPVTTGGFFLQGVPCQG